MSQCKLCGYSELTFDKDKIIKSAMDKMHLMGREILNTERLIKELRYIDRHESGELVFRDGRIYLGDRPLIECKITQRIAQIDTVRKMRLEIVGMLGD